MKATIFFVISSAANQNLFLQLATGKSSYVIGFKEFLGEVVYSDPRPTQLSHYLTSIRYCTIKYRPLRKVLDKYPRVVQNMLKILVNRLQN